MPVDNRLRVLEVLKVERDGKALAPLMLNRADSIIRVRLLLRKMDDRYVCALASKQDRDRTTNTGAAGRTLGITRGHSKWEVDSLSTSDDRLLILQLSGANIGLGTRGSLQTCAERLGLHGLLQTRELLGLRRDFLLQRLTFVLAHVDFRDTREITSV